MQQAWEDFLKNNNIDDEVDVKTSAVISPLSDFTILAVSGEDRHDFLHGQFINDLNLINNPSAQLSAWCNPKGQVISNFIIINTGISYLLIFKKELKDTIQKRLSMFVLRSDVKIEDITDSSPLVGLANINDLSVLTEKMPTKAGEIIATEGLIIVSHPDNSGRYLITGTLDALIKKLSKLKIKLCDDSAWNILDIQSGLPWISKATQEQFLPQMLNMDALKGLSYQKGCYPGQEVVARLHYRGEVKKRVQIIKSSHELYIGEDVTSSENKVGTIINSVNKSNSEYFGLAIINLDALNDSLKVKNNEIELHKLPYIIN